MTSRYFQRCFFFFPRAGRQSFRPGFTLASFFLLFATGMALVTQPLAAHAAPRPSSLQANEIESDGPMPLYRQQEADRKAAALHEWRVSAKAPSTNQLQYDVRFYELDLTVDPSQSLVSGTVDVRATVLQEPLSSIELDMDSALTASAVRVNGSSTSFSHLASLLNVDLDRDYQTGENLTVSIDYSGTPNASLGAFGFDTHNSQPMVWSLSEPYGARTWWPCKDSPSDKPDSARIRLTVPDNLKAISNGVLESTTTDAGWKTYDWFEKYPIAAYLISLAIHPYVEQSTTYFSLSGDPMPVTAWSFSEDAGAAASAIFTVVNEISTFAPLFGEYPFVDEKYGQAQFLWGGGMEHQTVTSICCWTDWIMAHELAHQWYGDAITCDSFSDIWLNEGFATYSEALWDESNGGFWAYRNNLLNNQYFGAGTIYIPPEDLDNESRIFDGSLSYNKASWVLHMLRGMVGDTTFFDILRGWTASPTVAYGTATTADFEAVAESVSGLDLSNFFNNWIYKEYFPTYSYSWNATDLGANWQLDIQLEQLQSHTLYKMPVPIRVTTTAGTEDFKLDNNAFSQSFTLNTSAQPTAVSLDPDSWILKSVENSVDAPTFHRGILVVNGVDWSVYGTEITSTYADSTCSGWMPFEFWDAFSEPAGGYVPELPAPLGHGNIPPETLGQFSTVIWVGNDYQGDLGVWTDAAILSYLRKGGNVLLLGRHGQNFLTPVRASYQGIRWAESAYNTIALAQATHPSLVDMQPIGDQSQIAVFETAYNQSESQTLLVEPTTFSVPRALAVWRQPLGGGSLRHSGAHFAHVAGRPYRWNHAQLRTNVQAILSDLFSESGIPTSTPPPVRAFALMAPVPNPFNPRVDLRFNLAREGHARMNVYDLRGRLVRVLINREMPAGAGHAVWDGMDERGRPAASGVYSVVLESSGDRQSQKTTLIR